MRNGYILLHRKGITEEEWKHPLRTLAWIDLLTLAAWDDHNNDDGVALKRGEIIASISFLERRWRQNRGTILRWLRHWETQQMVQRVTQHPSQQLPQRLFVLNYAKYQDTPQRPSQLVPQQVSQPMKVKEKNEDKKERERTTVSPIAESTFQFIEELCQQTGLTNKVNIRVLDMLVDRYKNLQLRVEVRKLAGWLADHGKRDISTARLTNWLVKATEIQKREENKRLEWQQAQKDPALAQRLRERGEEKPAGVKVEEFRIHPDVKNRLSAVFPDSHA